MVTHNCRSEVKSNPVFKLLGIYFENSETTSDKISELETRIKNLERLVKTISTENRVKNKELDSRIMGL